MGEVFTGFFLGAAIDEDFAAGEGFTIGGGFTIDEGFAAGEGFAIGEDFTGSEDFSIGAARLDADALAPCTAGETIRGFVLPISAFPLNHRRFPAVADASSDICRNYELVGIGSIACAKSEVSFAIPSEGGCWIARA